MYDFVHQLLAKSMRCILFNSISMRTYVSSFSACQAAHILMSSTSLCYSSIYIITIATPQIQYCHASLGGKFDMILMKRQTFVTLLRC